MSLALTGLPCRTELTATAQTIATCQSVDGAIAWERVGDTAGKVDAWDHVECAMALLVAGRDAETLAAYEWLAAQQRPDGTWPREWQVSHLRDAGAIRVADPGVDTNMCAYFAVGVWHYWCARGDEAVVARLLPSVVAALDAVVARQLGFGGFAWADDPFGGTVQDALVAGSASIHHALRCGIALARVCGARQPEWQLAADALREALRTLEGRFLDKSRYSMDWYYPVLGGAVTGAAARARLAQRWDEFVVPGLGIHCVDDHPWVTGAETCELALALTRLGRRDDARRLIADVQHLRDESGAYHTGFVYTDGLRWPIERSSWTGAAVILALDALRADSPTARVFTT
ncbi:MAG: prenyltransferase [Micrococcales bacterium]|nr:prenyltransferase [Micrococcales bacterium]